MKYEEMSDRQIERKIFEIHFGSGDKDLERRWDRGKFNYCNNPSDIMPIAIKYGISSVYMVDYWAAHGLNEELGNDEDWASESESLYRAIAICFLKMMDAKNGH